MTMVAALTQPSQLLHPLATPAQLAGPHDGVPPDLADSVRFHSAQLLQAAGILLQLPQEIIAQAIVLLWRFGTAEAGSLLKHDAWTVTAAALFLAAKPSAYPVRASKILTVFAYLRALPPGGLLTLSKPSSSSSSQDPATSTSWDLPASMLEDHRAELYAAEAALLRALGFDTHVALPHALCINYLQTLGVSFSSSSSNRSDDKDRALIAAALAHLNTLLFSPQRVYLTHQPPHLATAAIYLAAREVGVSLPETEWWAVFDTDRETLGFLVVAVQSTRAYAADQHARWAGRGRKVPMTVEEVAVEMEQRGVEVTETEAGFEVRREES